MLSYEDNNLLTRTGADTPGGDFFRRFWLPVLERAEIARPDSPQVRVRVLGEDLIAFRDSDGHAALVSAWCPHRGADLFYGRNEQGGLRCAYHGWKFDRTGQCVDLPNSREGEVGKRNVRIRSYPTREYGGMIWAYLGPADREPKMPDLGWGDSPDDHFLTQRLEMPGNYFQYIEGALDSSHVSFLHSSVADQSSSLSEGENFMPGQIYSDRSPIWEILDNTPYGLMAGAVRGSRESGNVRVSQYFLPCHIRIPMPVGAPSVSIFIVPADDEHSIVFSHNWKPHAAFSAEERGFLARIGAHVELQPGTRKPIFTRENDYGLDREKQRTETFTGIPGVILEDHAVQQVVKGQLIADRSSEILVQADKALVAGRQRMLAGIKALMKDGNAVEAAEADHRWHAVDVQLKGRTPRDAIAETLRVEVETRDQHAAA